VGGKKRWCLGGGEFGEFHYQWVGGIGEETTSFPVRKDNFTGREEKSDVFIGGEGGGRRTAFEGES